MMFSSLGLGFDDRVVMDRLGLRNRHLVRNSENTGSLFQSFQFQKELGINKKKEKVIKIKNFEEYEIAKLDRYCRYRQAE